MYHSAVGRGTGISIRATTGGENGLVVLGYHTNRKRIHEAIVRLTTWIKAESDAREVFNNNLVEKYNNMESELIRIREESKKTSSENIQAIKEEFKKSHSDNTKEINIPETEIFDQKIVMAGDPELSIKQDHIVNDNPAVKGQNT